MPRKGASAKRRLSGEINQPPIENPAPELVAQDERLRRTRSRMALSSKPSKVKSKTQPGPNNQNVGPTDQFVADMDVDPASAPSQASSSARSLRALPNAANASIATTQRATRSRSLAAALVSGENVPPGKLKRTTVKPQAAPLGDNDEAEFGTPDPIDDGDESEFEEQDVHESDFDDHGKKQASGKKSGKKAPSAKSKGKSKQIIDQASSKLANLKLRNPKAPGATMLKSTPANKWTEASINDLPPLSDIDDIFADLTKNHAGLVDVAKHLNGRPLRVATMCSGTESPLLALGLMIKHLQNIFGVRMFFEHLFSCEIEPFKQAYIERNFRPKVLFRDVCELEEDYATTAYGSKVKVPGDCDMLVAGTSCVDYSSLNNHGKGLEEGGESGRTFYGMLGWVMKHQPKIVILENVCNAPWGEVVKRFEDIGYVAGHSRFDTKNFYIPHTRQRGYLVAFLENGSSENNLPENWVKIVNAKTRPASVSFEQLCLEDDHPKVVEVRVKLQDDTSNSKAHEWIACEHRHANVRASEKLGRQRPFTSWQENGRSICPDNAWRDWVDRQVDRVKDLMDINYLRSASKGIDLVFVARVHNLSQNADRNTEGKGNGLTQCLTPSMIPYSTYRGGPLIGIELLSLQGLPTDELLFTRETEANLKDLAGNAMSSTVVGTAMAAALVVGMNLLDQGDGSHLSVLKPAISTDSPITLSQFQYSEVINLATCKRFELKDLKSAAAKSARKCVCEARTLIATSKIQICRACGHTSCQLCGTKPPHEYEPLHLTRRDPSLFESALKDLLPMIVKFKGAKNAVSCAMRHAANIPGKNTEWNLFQSSILAALSSTFTFSTMKRKEMWIVKYESPAGRLDLLLGPQQFEWRLFVKIDNSSKHFKELRRLFTPPAAHMLVDHASNSLFEGIWRIGLPGTVDIDVNVEGSGTQLDSWEKSLGLLDPSFIHKAVYSMVNISLPDPTQAVHLDADITGEWQLLPNCGTACRALHVKRDARGNPLFLFIDPHRIGDGTKDGFVIARDCKRLEFGEYRPVIARFDSVFRANAEKKRVATQLTIDTFWVQVESLRLKASGGVQAQISFSSPEDIAAHSSCSSPIAFLASATQLTPALSGVFPSEWKIVDETNAKRTFGAISWIVERIKPKRDGIWMVFDIKNLELSCAICAPPKPSISWKPSRGKMAFIEDPEQSAVWERAMKARPQPWVTALKVDDQNLLHLNIGINIVSLCHRAADLLPDGVGLGDLSVTWKLDSSYANPPQLRLPAFTVQSNRNDRESSQPPGFRLALRPEQLRSLSWMIEQESSKTQPFIEQEVVEALHPKLPWKVDVKASRPNSARGGILADAVGYGKTAIILGLLTCTKSSYLPPKECNGRIPVNATLIIVPGHLVDQWASEIIKFTGSLFRVLVVKTMANLKALTINDVLQADIILAPESLVRSPIYLERLAEFSGGNEPPAKPGRRFEQWLKSCKERATSQIRHLQSGATDKVLSEIYDGFARRKQAKIDEAEAQILGRKAHNRAAAKGKPDTESPQTSDTEVESEIEDDPVQKKSKAKVKAAAYDDQNWRLKSIKGDWKKLRTPLFELFQFNRLVLDEFTYCKGIPLEIVPNLFATFRWVLSGTPSLGDFDDVKRIARFLGIGLGIDDDVANSDINNRKIAKERSAVEAFHAFRETHTTAWHEDRQVHAQRFLNQFMRQNVAEIDEIPWEEKFITLSLPAAEKAIYIELEHHLKAMEMNLTRRNNSKSGGDRETRLRSALGESMSAEEALLKSCCHFSLNMGDLDEKATARTACDFVVQQREKQLTANKEELFNVLRTALLKVRKSTDASIPRGEDPFLKFIEQKRRGNLEDATATLNFRQILQQAKDWSVANESNQHVVLDNDTDDIAREDTGTSTGEAKFDPTRDTKLRVNRLLKELVGRCRSLRFFKLVREVQTCNPVSQIEWVCGCGARQVPLENFFVSSLCGHAACAECMARSADLQVCPEKVNGCDSSIQAANTIPLTSLGADDDALTKHGAKMDRLADLLRNVIPNDDRVLIFIQFPDLLKKVHAVLEEAGLSVTRLEGSSRAKSNDLSVFQSENGKRILLLEVMSETAAGANLTVANHVIFLSPLLTINQQQYLAAETQAIGRVRRYGQKKTVYIWRFAARDTIDTEVYTERNSAVPG